MPIKSRPDKLERQLGEDDQRSKGLRMLYKNQIWAQAEESSEGANKKTNVSNDYRAKVAEKLDSVFS